MKEISNLSMLVLVALVMIPMSLSYLFALGLNRTILLSSIRGVVQLIVIGYVLTFLFSLDAWQGITVMLTVMIVVASRHASKKGKALPRVTLVAFLAVGTTEAVVLSLWLLFDIIPFAPQQVIPMSGMIVGNSMIAAGLALERMKREFHTNRGRLLAALSLGATPSQASLSLKKQTLKAGLLPNIDKLVTVGIVQLPGMMTGLIVAGAPPIEAIRYQIVISLSIFASVSMSTMLVTLIMSRAFFNRDFQLQSYGIDQ